MKKIHLFQTLVLFAATLILCTACKKDTQDLQNPEDLLIGTWTVVSSEDALYNGYTEEYEILKDNSAGLIFTFNEDGSMLMTYLDGYSETAQWTYSGNILTMKFSDGFTDNPEVTLLEENNMKLYYDFGEQEGHPIYATMDLEKKN